MPSTLGKSSAFVRRRWLYFAYISSSLEAQDLDQSKQLEFQQAGDDAENQRSKCGDEVNSEVLDNVEDAHNKRQHAVPVMIFRKCS